MIFGYRRDLFFAYGLSVPVELGTDTHPHALITGASGSGKSQALDFLIGKLLQSNPEITVHICDFKNSDEFSFLNGYPYYYAGKSCYQGLMKYYNLFSERREAGKNKNRHVLIFDEYPAFINYLQMKDKAEKTKHANDVLGAVSEILMLGRGIGFGLWIVTQRADSTLFANGARDNFMIIVALGRISREQKGMIFPGEDLPGGVCGVGEGLLLADGHEITPVKYPLLRDPAEWNGHILQILTDRALADG